MNAVAESPRGGSDTLLIPAWLIIAVALGLFAVQLLMGTDPAFACLVLLFVLLSGVATNIAGGLRSVSGLLIGLCAFKVVILSQFLKIWFGQPAHTHLEQPIVTMLIMVVAAVGMLTVALMVRVLPLPRQGLLRPVPAPHMLLKIGLLSLAFVVVSFAVTRIGDASGSFGGIFGVARIIGPPASVLTVVAITAYAIVSTGRRRSLTVLSATVLAFMTGLGLLSFSKQAALEPIVTYAVTCLAFRYRINWLQAVAALAFVVLALQFVGPVMTLVRDPNMALSQRIDLIEKTVENLFASDKILKEHDYWARELNYDIMMTPYYGKSEPIIDRYTPMHIDWVAHGVESFGTLGWASLKHGFEMLLPRFLHPDKPIRPSQTVIRFHLDRRAAKDDNQFAFPLFADGYVSFGYLGTYLFTVVFIGIIILEVKILADRLTDNIWAAFLLVLFHHAFAEGNANIYMLAATHSMLVTLAFVFVVKWLARYKFDLLGGMRTRPSLPPPPPRLPPMRVHSAGD